jgi:acetolactate synthase I/II/III large subunit
MLGHDAIAQALVDEGVDTVFGVLGDGNLFIGEVLVRTHEVNFVGATHEANAVSMAEGWSKATGRIGVATCTHGPGLTNTTTALVEGTRNRTPMILLTGDTPRDMRHHLQRIDQHALVVATGAGFEPVNAPHTIAEDVARAFRRARAERRPIVLNMALDMEWEDVDYVPAARVEPPQLALGADAAALDAAVGIIASAARPIVLGGKGAAKSGARDALVELAARLGAPLATSLLGTSLFAGEAHDIGICGTLSHSLAGEVIADADCLITFGASLNQFTTDEGRLLSGKRIVQVDLDPATIGHYQPADAAVIGDAKTVAETMTAMLDEAEHTPSNFAGADLAERVRSFDRSSDFDDLSTADAVDLRTFTREVDAMLPLDRTVAIDAGRFMLYGLTLGVPDPGSLITSHAFGAIGLGMSTAIGAAVARPDRPTVLAIGDGGFMMGGMIELSTAAHLGLDLVVLLYNDGSYGAEHIQLYRKQMDPSASLHEWPDLVAVAESYGCAATRVSNRDDLAGLADIIKNRDTSRPLLIEATIDPDVFSSIMD